jgi:hypothetical protein
LALAVVAICVSPDPAGAREAPLDPLLARLLPTGEAAAIGLEPTEARGRTLAEVAANYRDPAAATNRFVAWGWQANAIGRDGPPAGVALPPAATDSLYVSLHRFADAAGADLALDYSVDDQMATTDAHEEGGIPVGDASRVLVRQDAAGSEITLYTRSGALLVRLTVTSPAGDPTADAFAVAQTIVAEASAS